MYDYIEGFCPVAHYRCLMPVEYEQREDKQYYKTKMACSCLNECGNVENCEHFQNAPETQVKWKLRNEKLG